MVKACLTARLTSRAGTKVGHSDPGAPCGRALDQRIKGTLGIKYNTMLSHPVAILGKARTHHMLNNNGIIYNTVKQDG